MNITSIKRRVGFLQILATINGAAFEFVSRNAEEFEVYDYPKTWRGVPRYVGAMNDETSAKLRKIAREHEADGPAYWPLYQQGIIA